MSHVDRRYIQVCIFLIHPEYSQNFTNNNITCTFFDILPVTGLPAFIRDIDVFQKIYRYFNYFKHCLAVDEYPPRLTDIIVTPVICIIYKSCVLSFSFTGMITRWCSMLEYNRQNTLSEHDCKSAIAANVTRYHSAWMRAQRKRVRVRTKINWMLEVQSHAFHIHTKLLPRSPCDGTRKWERAEEGVNGAAVSSTSMSLHL